MNSIFPIRTASYRTFALLLAVVFAMTAPGAEASFFDSAGSPPSSPGSSLPGNPPPASSFFGSSQGAGGGYFNSPPPYQPPATGQQPGSFFGSGGSIVPPQGIPPFGQSAQNIKIAAYGDSIVRGVGASSGNGFVSLLSARTGISIANAGVSGMTSASALQSLESSLLASNPDIVILFVGGNDILQRAPAATIFANVNDLVARIKSSGASVILLGIHDPIFGIDYETGFRQIAISNQTYFVPGVLEDILGRPFLMADAIHPNDQGHRLIADRVEPVLRVAIQDRLGGQASGSLACAASPAAPSVGQSVTWTANVTGASGPMAFSWSGDGNLLGNGQTARISYGTAGTKTAVVHFASSAFSASASCTVTVTDPPASTCTPFFRIGSFVLCRR